MHGQNDARMESITNYFTYCCNQVDTCNWHLFPTRMFNDSQMSRAHTNTHTAFIKMSAFDFKICRENVYVMQKTLQIAITIFISGTP